MTASITDPKTKHFDHGPLGTDELELQGRIDGILNRHPAVGLAVGVIRNGASSSSPATDSPTSPRTHP